MNRTDPTATLDSPSPHSVPTRGVQRRLPRSINLHRLRNFIVAAEVENFQIAARALNITQPSLSQQIQELEEELGVKLFDRVSRGVRLSRAGVVFLEDASNLLANLDRSIERARRVGRGEVGSFRVAFNETSAQQHVTAEAVHRFRAHFPDVNLELLTMPSPEQREALLNDSIDVGFRHDIDMGVTPEQRKLRGLTQNLMLQKDNLVLAISKYHRLARERSVSLKDLNGQTFIWAIRHGDRQLRRFIFDHLSNNKIDNFKLIEAGSHAAALNLVSIGEGIALVFPSWRLLSPKTMIFRAMPGAQIPCSSTLSWRKDNLSPQLQHFVSIVVDVLRSKAAPSAHARARPASVKPGKKRATGA